MVELNRLLHSRIGIVFISILLGLGLATLFRKVCKDKACIEFSGPILAEVGGKIYKHGEKCYEYRLESDICRENKRTIEFREKEKDGPLLK